MYGNVKCKKVNFVITLNSKAQKMAATMLLPQQISRIPAELARHVGRASVVDVHKELNKKYARFIAKLNTRTTCLHCGANFYPRDNLTTRGCWMHPGRIIYPLSGVREWSCCGNSYDILGCIPCMHADVPAIKDSILRDPLHSIAEVPTEVLDFRLVNYSVDMIEDYPEGGPSYYKDRPGKFYHIRRVAI